MGSLLNMFNTFLNVNYKYWWILFRKDYHSEIDHEWNIPLRKKRFKEELNWEWETRPLDRMSTISGNDRPLPQYTFCSEQVLPIHNLIWSSWFPVRFSASSSLLLRNKDLGAEENSIPLKRGSPGNDQFILAVWAVSPVWSSCISPLYWVQQAHIFFD